MIGDTANFVGGLLTGQLFTQVAQAGYFLFMDSILSIQFVVFNFMRCMWKRHKKNKKNGSVEKKKKNLKILKNIDTSSLAKQTEEIEKDESFFGEKQDEEDYVETPKGLIEEEIDANNEKKKLISQKSIFGFLFIGIFVFIGINFLSFGIGKANSHGHGNNNFGRKLMSFVKSSSNSKLRDDSGEDYGFPPKGLCSVFFFKNLQRNLNFLLI